MENGVNNQFPFDKKSRKGYYKAIIWIIIVAVGFIICGVGIWSVKIITNSMKEDNVKLPDGNQTGSFKVDDLEVFTKERKLQFLKNFNDSINLLNKYYYSYTNKAYYDANGQVKLDASNFGSFSGTINIKDVHILMVGDMMSDNKQLYLIQAKNDFEVVNINNIRHYIPLTTGKDYANRELIALSISSKDENINGIYNLKGEKISNYRASYGSKNLLGNDSGKFYYYKNDYIMYDGENGVGLLDMNGNVILEAKYKTLVQAKNNTYIALLNEKYGIIDYKGEVIVPFDNDLIIEFNSVYMLVKDKSFALMDENYNLITDYTMDYNPEWEYLHFKNGTGFNPLYSLDYKDKHLISFYHDPSQLAGYTYIIDEKGNSQKKDALFDVNEDYLYSKELNDNEVIIKVYDDQLNVKNTIKYEKTGDYLSISNVENSMIGIYDSLNGKGVKTCYSLETGEKTTCPSSVSSGEVLQFTSGNYKVYKENDKYIAYYNDKKIIESSNPIDDINDTYVVIRKSIDDNVYHDEHKLYKFIEW